jgi:hypothetical protein
MLPRGEYVVHDLESGPRSNGDGWHSVVFSSIVHTPRAGWTRLHFSQVMLEAGSTVRVTSLLDGDVQELDAAGIAMWRNSTAYFNGDSVLVELVAGPFTRRNSISLDRVEVELAPPGDAALTLCGICGGSDDRVPSNVHYAGRLMPSGCSAAVFNECSCIVSAGHCFPPGANPVIQFNVPNSTPGCFLQNPSAADQFPLTAWEFNPGGTPGSDWAVATTGFNNQNQKIYDRYGEFRDIATSAPGGGQSIDIWGYGASKTCTLTQTQQHSTGNITGVQSNLFNHNADATPGNSGSGVFRNDQILGIVTHCPGQGCPPGANVAQRMDIASFVNARNNLCPCVPDNNCCPQGIVLGNGVHSFSTINATTCGPDELPGGPCDLFGETAVQNDVWFATVASCDGELTVSLCGSSYTTKLALYGFQCPTEPGTVIACDVVSCPGENRATVTIPVNQNEAFRIRIGGFGGATGDGIMTISCQPLAPECPWDLNDDNVVDVLDLLGLLDAWGPNPGHPADFNGDDVVDVLDLLTLLDNWGQCP